MQFREAGNRIQVLAYRGYDKEKRRAVVKLLGSYDRNNPDSRTENLTYDMTGDEVQELNAHIETVRQSDRKTKLLETLQHTPKQINELCDCIGTRTFDSRIVLSVTDDMIAAAERLLGTFKKYKKIAGPNTEAERR